MHLQTFLPVFGAFGWMSIMLLLGVVLRARIGFFQRFMFPAAIIGGLIGFALKSLGWCDIGYDTFAVFALHFFTLNFISIGLTGTEDAVAPEGANMRRVILKGMLWMTFFYTVYFGRRLPNYSLERTVAMFGVVTGTSGSGMMLLRICDPDFKTPVSWELAMQTMFGLVIMPATIIMFTLPKVGFVAGILMPVCLVVGGLIVFKLTGQWKKPAW